MKRLVLWAGGSVPGAKASVWGGWAVGREEGGIGAAGGEGCRVRQSLSLCMRLRGEGGWRGTFPLDGVLGGAF